MKCRICTCLYIWTIVTLVYFTALQNSWAQTVSKAPSFQSELDQLLTIKRVTIASFSDNAQGIYARPLEAHFIGLLSNNHRWDYSSTNSIGPILTPDELEDDPDKAAAYSSGLDADAFYACRITKGPSGISIKLSFFLKKDSKLFAQAIVRDLQRFDINDMKQQLNELHNQILKKIPYSGVIMSRQGNRVTVNLGRKDGVDKDQILTVIQFIKLTRHPKFNFLVSTEKEILGRIKLVKVDETLSFGAVITERESGAIQKDSKLGPIDFVVYPETDLLNGGSSEGQLGQQPQNQVSFGQSPKAWIPQREPTFGQIGAAAGINLFNGSTRLTSYGSLETSALLAPSVSFMGELWVTSNFTLRAVFRQAIIPVKNPYSGATPSELSQNLSYYEMTVGYNHRFGPSIWDPSAEAFLGLLNYKLYVDDSSPEAYTTKTYSGFKFGLKGSLPVTNDKLWYGGGHLAMVWKPSLSESPVTSGATNENSINQFGLFGGRKITERIKAQANLDFELYSSTFSGNGSRTDDARSSSQRHTVITGAIYYMF